MDNDKYWVEMYKRANEGRSKDEILSELLAKAKTFRKSLIGPQLDLFSSYAEVLAEFILAKEKEAFLMGVRFSDRCHMLTNKEDARNK